jgi:hypothetical protein
LKNCWKNFVCEISDSRERGGIESRKTGLNKFGEMQQMMKKMGKFSKMMTKMGGGLPGMLRR